MFSSTLFRAAKEYFKFGVILKCVEDVISF